MIFFVYGLFVLILLNNLYRYYEFSVTLVTIRFFFNFLINALKFKLISGVLYTIDYLTFSCIKFRGVGKKVIISPAYVLADTDVRSHFTTQLMDATIKSELETDFPLPNIINTTFPRFMDSHNRLKNDINTLRDLNNDSSGEELNIDLNRLVGHITDGIANGYTYCIEIARCYVNKSYGLVPADVNSENVVPFLHKSTESYDLFLNYLMSSSGNNNNVSGLAYERLINDFRYVDEYQEASGEFITLGDAEAPSTGDFATGLLRMKYSTINVSGPNTEVVSLEKIAICPESMEVTPYVVDPGSLPLGFSKEILDLLVMPDF